LEGPYCGGGQAGEHDHSIVYTWGKTGITSNYHLRREVTAKLTTSDSMAKKELGGELKKKKEA